ncbi:hypothetical protein [Chryseobacterium gambrini]|uniref:Uncharacterized protein n=1 Tax=Chryseobacterium gambrini TaxID=373672 RepID=A0A1N7MWS8_9FLAO|nr:hypothetical protein [Chryseobacterium gambrini]SIS90391.1 hypothetical protein SAMN05421785_103547 [Chryseobacterium gambrini]
MILTDFENLKEALENYLKHVENSGSRPPGNYKFIDRFIEPIYKTLALPITKRRAIRLAENLKNSALKDYHEEFYLNDNDINFFEANYKLGDYIVFEIIDNPDYDGTNSLITFMISKFNDDEKKYLIFNKPQIIDLPVDLATEYSKKFLEKTWIDKFNKYFRGFPFALTNTQKVYIKYDDIFVKFCNKVKGSKNNFLVFETMIVSFDIEDLLNLEAPQSILEIGRFSLLYKIIDDSNSILDAADVVITHPPVEHVP